MRDSAANDLINKIIDDVNKNGFDHEKLIENFKELRPYALKEEDPLATKVLRLAYQYLEENEDFDLVIEEEEFIDDDGEVIQPETPETTTEENVINFVSLLINNSNEYNREDLRAYRDMFYESH